MLAHSVRVAKLVKQAINPQEKVIDAKYDKPKEKKVIDPEEVLKNEIREAVGKVDPIIKPIVEATLSKLNYRRKNKFEAMDLVVGELDKKVQALQARRFEMTEV